MAYHNQEATLNARHRVLQTIWSAGFFSVASAGILFYVLAKQPKFTQELGTFQLIGLAFCVSYLMSFVIPPMIRKSNMVGLKNSFDKTNLQGPDDEGISQKVFNVIQTSTIIAIALTEGAAFANLTLYLVGNSIYSFAAGGFGLAVLLLHYPSSTKVTALVDEVVADLKSVSN
ncbi:MAG: hypothetical protein AAF939_09965 [Planctomycetota bacterium]